MHNCAGSSELSLLDDAICSKTTYAGSFICEIRNIFLICCLVIVNVIHDAQTVIVGNDRVVS